MNIIPFKERLVHYPIGENIGDAIKYIDDVTPLIKEIIKDYPVNIWCSGSSGAILATLLVKNLDNQCIICHVKKKGESSHHGNSFGKAQRAAINIVLDDFARSGETLDRIWQSAKEYVNSINILCLANCWNEINWRFAFVPNNFIIGDDSINPLWKDLEPTRVIREKEEIEFDMKF